MADGVANRLLSCCLLLVSRAPKEQQAGTAHKYSLDYESGRLKLWAHGFDAISGHLDGVLEYSKYLKEPTILLLTNLASCLIGIFKQASDESPCSLLRQAVQDAMELYPHIDNICYDSGSEGSQGSVIEELHDIIDTLYELAPTLNDVLENLRAPENLKLPPVTDFYRGLILDKFPNIRPYLVLRLAEGNTRCHEQLRSKRERNKISTGSTIDSNIQATTKGSTRGSIHYTSREIPEISVNDTPRVETGSFSGVGTHAQTSFYDSGLGMSQPSLRPPPSVSGFSEYSVLSYSTTGDRPSLPQMPENLGSKAGFNCPFCGLFQSQIYNLRQWRKHVYLDIKPYICTYVNCTAEQQSFGSTGQWMGHQKSHMLPDDSESSTNKCPLCFEEFSPSPTKLYHHISRHMEDIRIFALPPSYRQSEDDYLGDDDDSTKTMILGDSTSQNSGPPVIRGLSPGAVQNTLRQQLIAQGVFDKRELVGDWISSPSSIFGQQDENIVPICEGGNSISGSTHSTEFLEETPKPKDTEIIADGNDSITEARELSYSIPKKLPFPRNDNFIGRQLELDEIHKGLQDGSLGVSQPSIVVLHGPSGIGKTQIALEYAYSYENIYTSVWWVNASTKETLSQGFFGIAQELATNHIQNQIHQEPNNYSIASALGLSQNMVNQQGELSVDDERAVIKAVQSWLGDGKNKKWLLIIDSYDDPEKTGIMDFLPNDPPGGSVLVTSRVKTSYFERGVEIREFGVEDAMEILLKSARPWRKDINRAEFDTLRNNALGIVKKLGGVPLALDQAGAYISTNQATFSSVLTLFDEHSRKASSSAPEAARSYESDVLLTTWEASFKALTQDSQELLLLCAFLDNEDIWEGLFPQERLKMQFGIDSVEDSLEEIFKLSLAKRKRKPGVLGRSFYIHPLVHWWLRIRLEQSKREEKTSGVVLLIAAAVESPSNYIHSQGVDMKEALMPHIERCCNHICHYLYLGPIGTTKSLSILPFIKTLARVSQENLKYFQAEMLYKWVFEGQRKTSGSNHPSTLDTSHDIGFVFAIQGKCDEAIGWYRQALTGRERVLGIEHPDTLATMNCIAVVLYQQGKYGEALDWYKQALTREEKALGIEHPDILATASNIAVVLYKQGQYDEALNWYIRTLAGRAKILGNDHSDTLATINNIAGVYTQKGEHDEALRWYGRALTGRENALGGDHLDTLATSSDMAVALYRQGKCNEALGLYQKALAGREKALGKNHPDTLTVVNNMAVMSTQQGMYDEALELYRQALTGRENSLGINHADTLATMNNMAGTLVQKGRYDEASDLYRPTLSGREKVLGSDHPDTLATVNDMAVVLYKQGKYEEALGQYTLALSGRENYLGTEHPDTLATINNIAGVYTHQGKYGEALDLYRQALSGREKILGSDHPDTLATVNDIGVALYGQGKYDEAISCYRRVFAGREKALGSNHPDTLTTINNMAVVSAQHGSYDEALKWYTQALAGREKILGNGHPDTLATVNDIAVVLYQQGKYGKALEWHTRALTGRRKALDTAHPDILTSINNMGETFFQQRNYEEADKCYISALSGREKALGSDHPDMFTTFNDMAVLLYQRRNYHEALNLYRQALAGREKALGRQHPDTLTTINNMAVTFSWEGESGGALKLYEQALAGRENALGNNHPDTLETEKGMFAALCREGRYSEAHDFRQERISNDSSKDLSQY